VRTRTDTHEAILALVLRPEKVEACRGLNMALTLGRMALTPWARRD